MAASIRTKSRYATAAMQSFRAAAAKMMNARLLFCAAAGLAIAACSGSLEESDCPRIGLLPKAERITVFKDTGGQDITDVIGTGRIEGLSGTCETDEDGQIYVTLEMGLSAALGPTADLGSLVLPYFVAVTDGDEQVLTKKPAQFTVRFDEDERAVRSKVEIDTFPMPGVGGFVKDEYVVVVGFQLTPNQLNYNRRSGN